MSHCDVISSSELYVEGYASAKHEDTFRLVTCFSNVYSTHPVKRNIKIIEYAIISQTRNECLRRKEFSCCC